MKPHKSILFYLLTWPLISPALVEKEVLPVVCSQNLSQQECEDFSTRYNGLPFAQWWLKNQRKKSLSHSINKIFSEAQTLYLKGKIDLAKNRFRAVVDMIHQVDWHRNQRLIIHYSLLRLAQIDLDSLVEDYFRRAIAFAPDLDPDARIFPPPFVRQYESLKQSLPTSKVQLSKFYKHGYLVLIDGKLIDDKTVKLYSGQHRWSLVSNHSFPIHHSSTLPIDFEKIKATPIFRGHCEADRLPDNFLKSDLEYVKFADCHSNQPLTNLNTLKIQPNIDSHSLNMNKPHADPQEKKLKALFSSKWFWIGAGILTTALLVQQDEKDSSDSAPPTKRRGF